MKTNASAGCRYVATLRYANRQFLGVVMVRGSNNAIGVSEGR